MAEEKDVGFNYSITNLGGLEKFKLFVLLMRKTVAGEKEIGSHS